MIANGSDPYLPIAPPGFRSADSSPQASTRSQRAGLPCAIELNGMIRKECSYCGRDNDEGASFCRECGTATTEPPSEIFIPTPHRAEGVILAWIWDCLV